MADFARFFQQNNEIALKNYRTKIEKIK